MPCCKFALAAGPSVFFRPLSTLEEFVPKQVRGPTAALLGGLQYAVPRGITGNSFLNYLVFEAPHVYSLGTLKSEKRRRIKKAANEFVIKPLTNAEEFKELVHPIYMDFYERTRYSVGSARRQSRHFFQWADALFKLPGILILGAYQIDKLMGISTSFLYNDTLICATLLCTAESLRRYLPDLMLHAIRESASVCPGLARIYQGMYHGNTSLDAFYLERGARILRKPASLCLNPLARIMVKRLRPTQYRRLLGVLSDAEMKWVAGESVRVSQGNWKAVDGAHVLD